VNLQRIADRCLQFDRLEHNAASLQEERKRELSPEIVQEREVQRQPPAEAARPRNHPDLPGFVIDGILQRWLRGPNSLHSRHCALRAQRHILMSRSFLPTSL
jgi:hypothetical protein